MKENRAKESVARAKRRQREKLNKEQLLKESVEIFIAKGKTNKYIMDELDVEYSELVDIKLEMG